MATYAPHTGVRVYVVVREPVPGTMSAGLPAGVFMVFRGREAAESWAEELNSDPVMIHRYRVCEATWSNMETRTASSDGTAAGCASSRSS